MPRLQAFTGSRLARAIVAWCLGLLVLTFLAEPLFYAFTFVALAFSRAYQGVGLLLFLAAVVRGLLPRHRADLAPAALMAVFILVLSFAGGWLSYAGDRASAGVRFVLLRPFYDRVVEKIESGDRQFSLSEWWLAPEVEPGPPLRIVFHHSGGVIDNWQGTIYDPTDAVAAARGWQYDPTGPRFTAPQEIKDLFGGNLLWCYQLGAHYYRCGFT